MIEVKGLSKNYSSEQILVDVNLNLEQNRTYFLMGKNGAGKTTFIKCLLGLESYFGKILFDGKTLSEVKESVYAIFDDVPFYGNLSGYKNIELMTDGLKQLKENPAELSLLTRKKLKERVSSYSLGERKKLALICAILQKPKYLIFDEISNGLDIDTLDTLEEHLLCLKQSCTILATGHHFEFYKNIIDDVLILQDKKTICMENYMKEGESLYEIYRRSTKDN